MSRKTKTTATKEDPKPAPAPKLRFPEFREAEAWHIKPFEKLFTIGNGRDHIPSLSKSNIEKIKTAIPTPAEQQKIAECLTTLNDLITSQTQKHEALKSHKKGLMQQLFPSLEEQNTI